MKYLSDITISSLLVSGYEAFYILRYKLSLKSYRFKDIVKGNGRDSHRICYEFLNKTSRSFSLVIQLLGSELRDVVCLFYLVLRGLDTIGEANNMSLYYSFVSL
jgi:farnesyl-diphosphate farnesyltransferase